MEDLLKFINFPRDSGRIGRGEPTQNSVRRKTGAKNKNVEFIMQSAFDFSSLFTWKPMEWHKILSLDWGILNGMAGKSNGNKRLFNLLSLVEK